MHIIVRFQTQTLVASLLLTCKHVLCLFPLRQTKEQGNPMRCFTVKKKLNQKCYFLSKTLPNKILSEETLHQLK